MIDPFFEYFKQERTTVSQQFYGADVPKYKEYPRVPKIELPQPRECSADIGDLLRMRRSTRDYDVTPLSLLDIATLLHRALKGDDAEGRHRPFPSGGAKYPTEAYIIGLNVDSLQSGAYHYNVREHTLEKLREGHFETEVSTAFGYPFVRSAGAVLCLTFVKSRSIRKYGSLAYKLGMLEAGHVGQNVYLLSGALGLGCCGLAGGDKKETYDILGIDGGNEHLVYALAIGNPAEK